MRKFYWLLALPYVVTVKPYYEDQKMWSISGNPVPSCVSARDSDCDYIYDIAAALNEAHERRAHVTSIKDVQTSQDTNSLYWKDSKKAEWLPMEKVPTLNAEQMKSMKLITDKEACGQDDCGKESQ